MKKLLLMLTAVLAVALCFSSCSSGKAKNVSMYDLKNAMTEASDNFKEMKYASSDDEGAESLFTNISDMSYSKVEAFCIYYAADGTGNADEIAVIQVKDSKDLTEARQSLEAHLEKRKALYSTYDKSQLKKLDGARVVTNSDCVALIVADDSDKLSEVFQNYFDGD